MARSLLIAMTALISLALQPAHAAENFSSEARSYSADIYGSAARHWLELAERGHGPAQYNVGRMIYYGQGLRKDPIEALKWFLLASDNGIEQGRVAARTVGDRLPRHQYIEAARRARALSARLSR
jgi:TPR repeat protein